jgi:hypothetical protein
MSKKITRNCVNHIAFARKNLAWLSLSVCLLLNLLCLPPAQAAEILRETIPLERNEVPLHLERYIEQDGKIKRPILFVHGVTFSSHEFDVDYKDYSLARYLPNTDLRFGCSILQDLEILAASRTASCRIRIMLRKISHLL